MKKSILILRPQDFEFFSYSIIGIPFTKENIGNNLSTYLSRQENFLENLANIEDFYNSLVIKSGPSEVQTIWVDQQY